MPRRVHRMPFGAEIQANGRVRFRLWAPAAEEVILHIGDPLRPRRIEMAKTRDGWHERVTADAGPGSLYRYQIDGGLLVPDPASRFQPDDVHGPSEIIDPAAFQWHDGNWIGRPWEEMIIYELHVGTFSPAGTFDGVASQLDDLVELGISAIELMPVADFPGRCNWGYDGALLFAPDSCYGRPEGLKRLVQAAHDRNLMVFLDVVYNHFGPEGNYLHHYAPSFFTDRHPTPWGAGINLDGPDRLSVRDFFIHNALYWLTEYHLDGLRLDAVHALTDDNPRHFLIELAEAVQAGPGRARHVHLVLENDDNASRYLARRPDGAPRWYVAQWNDDFHHVAHLLATGETDGYYADYATAPLEHFGRSLAEGFAYQGEPSRFRNGARRGEPSATLSPTAFVNFLQTHDQAGNRAFGERIHALAPADALRALLTIMLLAPAPPLLFMGQEWHAPSPFLFFCDFGDEALRAAAKEGRQREFARFATFTDPQAWAAIPDPCAVTTNAACQLDWQRQGMPEHRAWRDLHRDLLALRQREIIPRLTGIRGGQADFLRLDPEGDDRLLRVRWGLGDDSMLVLHANLGDRPQLLDTSAQSVTGPILFSQPISAAKALASGQLPPWSAVWQLVG